MSAPISRLTVIATLAVVALVGYAALVVAVAVTAARDQVASADAIAVLGAAQYNGRPSPVLKARLDHAAALYQRGAAPVVLVTGGIGAGDSVSEADVGERYLRQLGLPPEAVRALPPSPSTYASVRQVRQWFAGRESRRVLFVSDGFHMLRLRIIAERAGLAPYTSSAPGSPIRGNARLNTGYMLAEGLKVPAAWLFQH
jgi:uncharacterized SAM-binding protein YcdF (DUF218 family)